MKAGSKGAKRSKSRTAIATFVARGDEDIQRFIALVGLGMCRAMSLGAVSAEYACHRLFGPAVMTRARKAGAGPELIEALHLASELVDVETIAPHAFEASLADVEGRLLKILRTMSPERGSTLSRAGDKAGKWLLVPRRSRRRTPRPKRG